MANIKDTVKHEASYQRELSDIVKQRESLSKNLHSQTRDIARKLLSNAQSDTGVSSVVSKILGKVLEDLGNIDKKYSEKRNDLEKKRQKVLTELAKANDKNKESILDKLGDIESGIRENESENAKNLIEQLRVQKNLEKTVKNSASLSESSIGKLLLKDSKKKAIEDLVNRKKDFNQNRKDILEGLKNQQAVLEATGASPLMLKAIQTQIKAVIEKDVLKFEKISKTVETLHESIEDEFAKAALERAKAFRSTSLAEKLLGKTIAGSLSNAKSAAYDRTVGALGSKVGSIGYKGLNLGNVAKMVGGALERRAASQDIKAASLDASSKNTPQSVLSKMSVDLNSREELNQLKKINRNLENLSSTGGSKDGMLSTITGALESIIGKGALGTIKSVLGGGLLARTGALLGPLGAVAAAGAVGYGIGTLISNRLSESTSDIIGSSLAKVLAFFGHEESKETVATNARMDAAKKGTPKAGYRKGSTPNETSPSATATPPSLSTPAPSAQGYRKGSTPNAMTVPAGSHSGAAPSTPTSGAPVAAPTGGSLSSLVRKADASVDLDGLQPAMSSRLQNAASQYTAATGKQLQVNSGKRSSQKQAELYARYLAGTGNPANKPGTSFHEVGLAADIQPSQVDEMQRLGILQSNGLERISGAGERQHLQVAGANALSAKSKGAVLSGDANVAQPPASQSLAPVASSVNKVSGSPLSLTESVAPTGGRPQEQVASARPTSSGSRGGGGSGKVDVTNVPTFMFNDPEFYAHNLSVM